MPAAPSPPLSHEHTSLVDTVRRVLADRLPASPAAAVVDDLAGLGMFAPFAADGGDGDDGGAVPGGGDPLAAVLLAEELGRADLSLAVRFLAAAVAAPFVAHGAPATFAAPSAADRVAASSDGGVRLRGTIAAALVPVDAGAVVVAVPGGRAGVYAVEAGAWRARPLALIGLDDAPIAEVTFPDAPAALVAPDPAAAADRFRLLVACAAVAAAARVEAETRDYAAQRTVFGRPLARFQATRHGLAVTATTLTAARELLADAVLADAHVPSAVGFAHRTTASVTDACLQLHGGYGYTTEFRVQQVWRDVRAAAALAPRDIPPFDNPMGVP